MDVPTCVRLVYTIGPDDAWQMFDELRVLPWEQPTVTVFGRQHLTPRLSWWCGPASYSYSGHRHRAAPMPPSVAQLAARICADIAPVNCCLLNFYRDGNDTMGEHADDEPELGPDPTVVTVSLGAARDMVVRRKADRATARVVVQHGEIWVMAPPCQQDFLHGIPRRKRVLDPRISLTFRCLNGYPAGVC